MYLTFKRDENVALITSEYGVDKLITFKFERFGINQIFSLSKVFITNHDESIIQQKSVEEQIISPITDWISPYAVVAKNDIDIPNNGNKYTGGNHGTNGGGGEATGKFVNLVAYKDGHLIDKDLENENVNESIELVTTNLIEASNAHIVKPRKVLEEKVTYKIIGTEIFVNVQVQFKEDCYLLEYSGLQSNGEYYNQVFIPNSQVLGFVDLGEEQLLSGDFKQYGLVDQIVLRNKDTKNILRIKLLKHTIFDLGEGTSLVESGQPPLNKMYFKLVKNTYKEVSKGYKYSFLGCYQFSQMD